LDVIQRIAQRFEGGDEFLGGAPSLFGSGRRRFGGGLGDAGEEGGVLDQALVALRVDEGVGYDVVFAVELAREEGVGEAGAGFLAGCEALGGGGGCWGLWRGGSVLGGGLKYGWFWGGGVPLWRVSCQVRPRLVEGLGNW
jgi:hypothetical protein